ncbi:MAG: phosphoribosylamine--glycine ligase, partial [Actinobacteria bacterium]|nr:phosphoribosylamine--glycine ligase [Actinomycetota bacterium]
ALRRVAAFGGAPVVEELLEGDEVSLFALVDGTDAYALPAAQDYKRLLDGDEGPNTGGMGAYTPALAADETEELVERVHRPVLAELARRGSPFVGLLYAGLMLTDDGPRVLEFNCRFGDPETQALLPALAGDLLPALDAAARGRLADADLQPSREAAVTVVVASAGYPDAPETGARIDGVAAAEQTGALVFHAGTAYRDGRLVSAGGRVLNVSSTGETVARARARAYQAVARLDVAGAQYRHDVAARAARVEGKHAREVARVAG